MVSDDLSTLTFGESVRKERLEQLAKIASNVDSQRVVKVEDRTRNKNSASHRMPPGMKEGDVKNDQRSGEGHDSKSQIEESVSESANKQTISHSMSQGASSQVESEISQKTDEEKYGNIQDVPPTPTSEVKESGTITPAVKEMKKTKSKSKKTKKVVAQTISLLTLIEKTLSEWKTEKTLQFLRGEEDEGIDKVSSAVEDDKASGGTVQHKPAKLETGQRHGVGVREELDSDDDSDEGKIS